MKSKTTEFLSPENDIKKTYDTLNDWLTEYDLLRIEAFARGGECEQLLEEMNEFWNNIDKIIKEAANEENEYKDLFLLFKNLFKMSEEFYIKTTISQLYIQIKYINNSADIPPYIITANNKELYDLRKALGSDNSMAELLEQFVHDIFFKLKANSLEDASEKMKFLFDKIKILKSE